MRRFRVWTNVNVGQRYLYRSRKMVLIILHHSLSLPRAFSFHKQPTFSAGGWFRLTDLLLSPRQLRLRPRPQPTFPVICAGGTHLQQRPIYHFVLGLCQKYCGHVIVYHQWMGGGGVQRWLSFSMRTRICLVYPRWLHGLYFGFSAVFWSQTLLSSALCQFPMLGSKFIFRHQN